MTGCKVDPRGLVCERARHQRARRARQHDVPRCLPLVEALDHRQLLAGINEFSIPMMAGLAPEPVAIRSDPYGNLWFGDYLGGDSSDEGHAGYIGTIAPVDRTTPSDPLQLAANTYVFLPSG